MPKLPLVAIIGRPNTGKSTLFNRLVGERRAIESDVPGTTRDHVAARVETDDVDYLLLDTGGIGGGTDDHEMEKNVQAQSMLAVSAADVILFTLNSREELTGSDFEVASLLRKKRRKHVPIILVITKCDNPETVDGLLPRYHELGIADDIIATSAFHGSGTAELEDTIEKNLKELHFHKDPNSELRTPNSIPKIAIIGKPNVGKSSFVNALMSDPQRETSPRLVSDIPGTTRDATDTIIRHDDKEFLFIDTAGLKRQAKTDEGIESFAMLRTIQALEACDVALLLIDGTQPISKQDKRIAGMVVEAGKGIILLVNKMDLLKSEARKEKMDEIKLEFPFCRYAPVIPCSTVTRDGLLKIFPLIEMIERNRTRRIPVKDLRRWYEDSVDSQPMSALQSAKHLTQAEDIPPTFVLFVRDPKGVQLSMLRYLDNRLRETFGFEGTPVRWVTKKTGRG